MNADKYQQLIVRRAVKAAKQKNRRTQDDLDLETLRNLKVATASPLSRVFFGGLGLILIGAMLSLQISDGFDWLLTLFGLIGLYFTVVAIRGRKKRISEIEDAIDILDAGGTLIEAIIENLDFSIDL